MRVRMSVKGVQTKFMRGSVSRICSGISDFRFESSDLKSQISN
jgi:hypothetical protein